MFQCYSLYLSHILLSPLCPQVSSLCLCLHFEVKVAQSFPTLCSPMDYSLPGSSVHEILQVRILEWVTVSFSRRSSQSRDWTQVSRIVCWFFTISAASVSTAAAAAAANRFSWVHCCPANWQPRGMGGVGVGSVRELQKEGDIRMLMADSCRYMSETNTIL